MIRAKSFPPLRQLATAASLWMFAAGFLGLLGGGVAFWIWNLAAPPVLIWDVTDRMAVTSWVSKAGLVVLFLGNSLYASADRSFGWRVRLAAALAALSSLFGILGLLPGNEIVYVGVWLVMTLVSSGQLWRLIQRIVPRAIAPQ